MRGMIVTWTRVGSCGVWLGSRCVLKEEPIGLASTLDMGHKGKKGVKNDVRFLV